MNEWTSKQTKERKDELMDRRSKILGTFCGNGQGFNSIWLDYFSRQFFLSYDKIGYSFLRQTQLSLFVIELIVIGSGYQIRCLCLQYHIPIPIPLRTSNSTNKTLSIWAVTDPSITYREVAKPLSSWLVHQIVEYLEFVFFFEYGLHSSFETTVLTISIPSCFVVLLFCCFVVSCVFCILSWLIVFVVDCWVGG